MGIDMQLSKRLKVVADYVTPNSKVADIGCDHAHTSIYLVTNQIADSVIAMDINKGPLARAKENIQRYGCSDKVKVRLSDGAKQLKAGETDTILISGMGGVLIRKILEDSQEVIKTNRELILQPQSEIPLVRRYLHQEGYCISGETMLVDEGKYYVVIKAIHGVEHYQKEVFYRYGKLLLENQNPILKKFLIYGMKKTNKIMEQLKNTSNHKAKERGKELEQELLWIREALEFYNPENGRSK